MTDTKLRKLERVAAADGGIEAQAALLKERLRQGQILKEQIDILAYCGYEAALVQHTAIGRLEKCPTNPSNDLDIWIDDLLDRAAAWQIGSTECQKCKGLTYPATVNACPTCKGSRIAPVTAEWQLAVRVSLAVASKTLEEWEKDLNNHHHISKCPYTTRVGIEPYYCLCRGVTVELRPRMAIEWCQRWLADPSKKNLSIVGKLGIYFDNGTLGILPARREAWWANVVLAIVRDSSSPAVLAILACAEIAGEATVKDLVCEAAIAWVLRTGAGNGSG